MPYNTHFICALSPAPHHHNNNHSKLSNEFLHIATFLHFEQMEEGDAAAVLHFARMLIIPNS